MLKKLLLVCAMLVVGSGSLVAAAPEWTLQECIRLALERNKDFVIARKELEAKKAAEHAALAATFPTLNFTGNFTYLDPKTVDDSKFPFQDPETGLPVVIQSAFPDNYSFGFAAQYAIPFIPFFSDGAWGRSHLGYRIAGKNRLLAEKKVKKIRKDTTAAVAKAFYSVLVAQKVTEVTEINHQRLLAYAQVAQRNYNAGRWSKYEKLRTDVQLAAHKPQRLNARNGLRMARLQLLHVLSMDLDKEFRLKGELKEENFSITEAEALKQALANRYELQELAMTVEIMKLNRDLAAAGNKPVLAAFANLNWDYKKGGSMFSSGDRSFQNSWNVGLNLTIPISELFPFWSQTYSKTDEARKNVDVMEKRRESLIDGIKMEIKSAVVNLQQQQKSIAAQVEAVSLAAEGLRMARVRYENGQMGNVELMDSELAYQQAQLAYYQALFAAISARIDLEKAIGKYQ